MARLEVFLVFGMLLKAWRDQVANQRSLAEIDDVTELFGRRAFFERLEQDVAFAQRRNSSILDCHRRPG